jgi:predicted permease
MPLPDLLLRIRALIARRRVERELDEELAFHIERDTQKHIAAGLSPAEARTRALARFGSVALAAERCRDVRGTTIVDDVFRDIGYAFRTFRRAPLAALTIVATVALGLGLVAVVFTVYSFLMLRVDAVREPEELFAVKLSRPDGSGGSEAVSIAPADYDALRSETGVFTDVAAMLDAGPSNIGGRSVRPKSVTGNFFQLLGVQAALGRTLMPSDEDGGSAIVLSHAGWHKLFQGDRAVIGRHVVISGAPYEVVGIMPEGFRGLGVTPPDFWLPLSVSTRLLDPSVVREGGGIEPIGRLKPGQSREAAAAVLAGWASGRAGLSTSAARPVQVWLIPSQGTLSGDGLGMHMVFAPLLLAFGLILAIGCANVANLLLARGVARQREIGTRLSLGASRRRIVRQLLTENLILSLAAAACGLVLARLFLDGAVYAVVTTLPPEISQLVTMLNLSAPTADWRVVVFVVAGAIASTAFFGLAPALQATRLDLVRTMRGEVARDARPSRARHTLIALQVGASALLLICAAVFLRGALGVATRDSGVRTTDTLWVNIDDESRRGALLRELRSDPIVAAVAASTPSTHGIVETSMSQSRTPADQIGVSSGYFDVLGFELLSGRSFTPAELTADAGVAVVSEVLARQLWPRDNAVGQTMRLEASSPTPSDSRPFSTPRTLTVIGVVRDQVSAVGMRVRGVYLPTGPDAAGTSLMLRVRANPEQARVALASRLPGLDPGFGVMTLRTVVGMQAYALGLAFWAAVVLGGLALALTVSGLFSVLSYVVAQQTKEIGVRMALGAATKHVTQLVLVQSLRPVAIGLAAGGGLAAAVAIVLIATPLAAEIGDSVNVLDPVAYAWSLMVIVSSCLVAVSLPALRAARIDPIETLRKD